MVQKWKPLVNAFHIVNYTERLGAMFIEPSPWMNGLPINEAVSFGLLEAQKGTLQLGKRCEQGSLGEPPTSAVLERIGLQFWLREFEFALSRCSEATVKEFCCVEPLLAFLPCPRPCVVPGSRPICNYISC